jgi:hypothetical protein
MRQGLALAIDYLVRVRLNDPSVDALPDPSPRCAGSG